MRFGGRTGTTATADEAPTVVGRWVARVAARVTPHARLLWALTVGTLLADVALTVYGVRLGLTEGNPFAAALIAEVGALPALLTLKGSALAVGGLGWASLPRGYRGVVPLALAIPWVTATVVNVLTVGAVLTA